MLTSKSKALPKFLGYVPDSQYTDIYVFFLKMIARNSYLCFDNFD